MAAPLSPFETAQPTAAPTAVPTVYKYPYTIRATVSTIGDDGVYVVRQKRAKESVNLIWRPIAGALSYKLEMRTALPIALEEIRELASLIDNSTSKANRTGHGVIAAVAPPDQGSTITVKAITRYDIGGTTQCGLSLCKLLLIGRHDDG